MLFDTNDCLKLRDEMRKKNKLTDSLPQRMPTAGLLDAPQDARFYDWLLKDPKDTPFATFKFHYRSWNSLEHLQLIPPEYPKTLQSPTPSLLSINGLSREFYDDFEDDCAEEGHTFEGFDSPAHSDSTESNCSSTPWMTTVFDVSPLKDSKSKDRNNGFDNSSESPSSPSIMSKFSAAVIDKPTTTRKQEKKAGKDYMNRPLPEIPVRRSSLKSRSRKSSACSNSPSVTASLRSWADRGESTSPEPEIGIATLVKIIPAPDKRDEGDSSQEDVEQTSKSAVHVANLAARYQYYDSMGAKQPCLERPITPYHTEYALHDQGFVDDMLKSKKNNLGIGHSHRLRRSRESNIFQDDLVNTSPEQADASSQHRQLRRNHDTENCQKMFADTSSIEESMFISAIENLPDPLTKLTPYPPRTSSRQGYTAPATSRTFSLSREVVNAAVRNPSPKSSSIKILPTAILDPILHGTPHQSPIMDDNHQSSLGDQTTLSLTESEWMCRTPSPIKSKFGQDIMGILQNVGPDKYKDNDEIEQMHEQDTEEHSMINPRLRKKATTWYKKVRGSTDIQESGGRSTRADSDDECIGGNWI